MVFIPLAGDGIGVHAVVREVVDGSLVLSLAQLVDVVGEHLAYALDVVEDADFLSDPLADPDGHCVGSGTGATKIPECAER